MSMEDDVLTPGKGTARCILRTIVEPPKLDLDLMRTPAVSLAERRR